MQQLIGSTGHSAPIAPPEVIIPGRTLKRRAVDVLACFDQPGTPNGPAEAINGRLEHLRGSGPRLPQPHHLHRQIASGDRRVQAPTTPSSMKSPID